MSVDVQDQPPKLIQLDWSLGNIDSIPQDFIAYSDSTRFPLDEPYWIKLHFLIEKEGYYVIKAGNSYMQSLEYYGISKEHLTTGNYHESFYSQGEYELLVYFPFHDFQDRNNISFSINNASDFYKSNIRDSAYHSVFIGILFFLFIMSSSFFILSSTSDKVYIYYAWYLFSILFFFSYQYGELGSFFPFINRINPYYIWVSSASISISYFFFAQVFLDLKKSDLFAYNLFEIGKYLVVAIVVTETIAFLIGYDIQHNAIYKIVILLLQMPLMILALYWVYKQKTTLSWIFLVGALILAVSTTLGQISSTLKTSDQTNYLIQIGLLVEVFIFSVGIGVRMWIIEEEKRKVQVSLLKQMEQNVEIQQKYTFELEQKVRARTIDLHTKNEEKDLLLKEIHHRVKNNLQTIASLLSIQSRRLKSDDAIHAIEDSMNRVMVMGLIHKFLYQKDTYTTIDLKEYVNQLLGMLIQSSNPIKRITPKVDVDSIILDIDRAINIGLILNELVTNSVKHAFAHLDDPMLSLSVKRKQNTITVLFSDNGNKPKINVLANPEGFGWKLINSLVSSLDGSLDFKVQDGFEVMITFPYNSPD